MAPRGYSPPTNAFPPRPFSLFYIPFLTFFEIRLQVSPRSTIFFSLLLFLLLFHLFLAPPPLLSFRYSSFLFGYCLKLIHKILRVDFFGLLSVSFLLLHFDFIFLFLHPFPFFFSHQTGQLKSIRLDGLIQSSQCQWDSTGTLHTGCITELQELDANCMLI